MQHIKLELYPPLLLNNLEFEFSDTITGLGIIGPFAALVAISFMKSMIFVSLIPKKFNISVWKAPIIAGILCGIIGLFLDEVLGLGTQTVLSVITQNLDLSFLFILLIGKLFLTSCCIGFGFFGGTFSQLCFLEL